MDRAPARADNPRCVAASFPPLEPAFTPRPEIVTLEIHHLELDGARLAYRHLRGRAPTVVFLCGFRSDMTGTKARHLEAICRDRGQAYLRLDYQGHGASSGRFEDGTIGRWRDDATQIVDSVTDGPLLLVGSSMGGWMMLLVALARPQRVAALLGIASAPDFTEDLLWARMSPDQRASLETDGRLHVPSAYSDEPTIITARLIEEGRRHLLLRAPIRLRCPVRLIHGVSDPDVPWQVSLRLMELLESPDVRLELIKNGDHRLSEPEHLAVMDANLVRLLDEL